jgi:hypothetical protein
MASQTYAIINNSTNTAAVINYIEIATTLTEQQHHLNLTGWNEPFNSSYTDFQGATTLLNVSKNYISDESPINRAYDAHTGIYVRVTGGTVSGIGAGWDVTGNHFTGGQTVVSTSGTTWVQLSAGPNGTPIVGEAITFTPPQFLLVVNNVSDISAGWAATGVGYNGQTVLSISAPQTLVMSAPPTTTPSGSITFTSAGDTMLTIAPLTSSTFSMDYNRVTSSYGTYTSLVSLHATLGTAITKNINNFMLVSVAPVGDPASPFFDSGGGGGGSATTCADSSAVSCSASPGGSCFTGDTLINIQGGKTKRIDQIEYGDLVVDALTGRLNKVIGIKVTDYGPNTKLFATKEGMKPFITEEHAFYNENNELCAISEQCEFLAPWLGPVKIVDVPVVEFTKEPIKVYNLYLETGTSHFANGIAVSNMVGHGSIYALLLKGYINQEDYFGYIYPAETAPRLNSLTQEQKVRLFNFFAAASRYILDNNNLRSKLLAKVLGWAIKNRDTLQPYSEKWFKSRIRNYIFGPKK